MNNLDEYELQDLRLKINERERKRMHDLNSALNSLREVTKKIYILMLKKWKECNLTIASLTSFLFWFAGNAIWPRSRSKEAFQDFYFAVSKKLHCQFENFNGRNAKNDFRSISSTNISNRYRLVDVLVFGRYVLSTSLYHCPQNCYKI